MSDEVAKVLAEGMFYGMRDAPILYREHPTAFDQQMARVALNALSEAGYAVVKTPDSSPAVEAVVKHHACSEPSQAVSCGHSTCILASLSCSGFAVVKLPEGVVVEHGARLESISWTSASTEKDADPGEWFLP